MDGESGSMGRCMGGRCIVAAGKGRWEGACAGPSSSRSRGLSLEGARRTRDEAGESAIRQSIDPKPGDFAAFLAWFLLLFHVAFASPLLLDARSLLPSITAIMNIQ